MPHLGGVSAVLPGLMVVLLLGLIALVAHRLRTAPRRHTPNVDTAPRLGREREWELVVRRARDAIAHAPRLEELQAAAALKIDSAEHAYNRLVNDCAGLCPVPVSPTLEPMRTLPRNRADADKAAEMAEATADPAETAPDRQPLAA